MKQVGWKQLGGIEVASRLLSDAKLCYLRAGRIFGESGRADIQQGQDRLREAREALDALIHRPKR